MQFEDCAWYEGSAGNGAALYMHTAGLMDLGIKRCLFRENVAAVEGGALFLGGVFGAKRLIQGSIFYANAVRSPQSEERTSAATVIQCECPKDACHDG
eukprot:COSAG04_NODE_85_length_27560_cov_8.621245_4_plen_98_part_00